MATPPPIQRINGSSHPRIFGRTRLLLLAVLVAILAACLIFSWMTRGSMESFSFLRSQRGTGSLNAKRTLVDLSPWQTAQTLSALAVTAEETEFAQDAMRLADHDVDQAFASALRQARLRAEHVTLTGEALNLSKKIQELQQLIIQDQAQVADLTAELSATGKKETSSPNLDNSDDLDVAKAQLGLDSDELADAGRDLDRATGDDSTRIQQELAAHETAMHQYDKTGRGSAQLAVASAKRHSNLAGRTAAWFDQISRRQSILQAQQRALQDAQTLITQHNALEAQADSSQAAGISATNAGSKLAAIKDRSAERQILSIYDDRIQTQQQLAAVYGKWAAQVQLQHGIVLHLILQSFATIVFILICMMLCNALVRRLMQHPKLDYRQTETLRSILELAIQVFGGLLILAGDLRNAERDAYHPRPRHGGAHLRLAGLHPCLSWLVYPDGQKRHSRRRLGRNQRRRRRGDRGSASSERPCLKPEPAKTDGIPRAAAPRL